MSVLSIAEQSVKAIMSIMSKSRKKKKNMHICIQYTLIFFALCCRQTENSQCHVEYVWQVMIMEWDGSHSESIFRSSEEIR